MSIQLLSPDFRSTFEDAKATFADAHNRKAEQYESLTLQIKETTKNLRSLVPDLSEDCQFFTTTLENNLAALADEQIHKKNIAANYAADPLKPLFDTVVVITDRRALDTAIARTIKGFDHVSSIFGHSDSADELRGYLSQGKKIIVTTVQKFPWVLDELGGMAAKRFALLIDEAHSSQGGKTTAKMHLALSGGEGDEEGDEESVEDKVMPVLNLLAADDVSILRRELHGKSGPASVADVRRAAKAAANPDASDAWQDQFTVHWSINTGDLNGGRRAN